jgi:putative transposase
MNQEQHHKRRNFHEEYIELLKKFNVSYEDKYILHDVT